MLADALGTWNDISVTSFIEAVPSWNIYSESRQGLPNLDENSTGGRAHTALVGTVPDICQS